MVMDGFTIWFTGLSGSGKTTLAHMLVDELKDMGRKVELLDGDVIRTNLSKGLGFSKEDRDENIRRVGFVCELLSRNGIIAIAACISPYKDIRDSHRGKIDRFFEVFTKCSIEECIKRDPKGNYKKVLSGEIKNYTGIDDPYEEPSDHEITVETDKESPEESLRKIINKLKELKFLPDCRSHCDKEEEKIIKDRLKSLGYL